MATPELNKLVAAYGTWTSPVSAEMVADSSVRLNEIEVDGDVVYWLETRPAESGRNVIVKRGPDGTKTDIIPRLMSARTTVHEYGGGNYIVENGSIYFSNYSDQALYKGFNSKTTKLISPENNLRFADCTYDKSRTRLICVCEDHRRAGEPRNMLVAMPVNAKPGEMTVLWGGSDFVAHPRINPDGTRLSWLAWDHPNMPWDDVSLMIADIREDGGLTAVRRLNDGSRESVLEPNWSEDGTLYFLTDRSGWWNLHRFQDNKIEAVHSHALDFGGPPWIFDSGFYVLVSPDAALVRYSEKDVGRLALLDLSTGELKPFALPFVSYRSIRAAAGQAYFIADRSEASPVIVQLNVNTGSYDILHEAGNAIVAEEYVSRARLIEFPTENNLTAFAHYYPPVNKNFVAPKGELPPLLVKVHGGPTSATDPGFDTLVQFWTSRGIAVLDVNYGGSTGYGRAYRQRLYGEWGVMDVQDTINAARYAVAQGRADPERLMIRGGSAGGFVTLAAMAFSDTFAAGANYYGVSDMESLAGDTHKFESHYLDQLVGPYPEQRELYRKRSPINSLESFTKPLITFQGAEDKVVPPNQSELIVAALRKKGVPVAYLLFEGEQHGFRQSWTIKRSLEAELYFYGKILGFKPAGRLPSIHIDNLN